MEVIIYFLYVERGNAKNAHWRAIFPDGRVVTHFLKRNYEGHNYVSSFSAADDFQFSWPTPISTKRIPMVIV